ncbi:MAG: hypothetical protein H6718_22860 [Polyangiaceae bacterium]|nr:hypothetical protein [Myxococcales bacterium]MCB9588266.1 hypothetical protein [Polyangiaceae bacterium]
MLGVLPLLAISFMLNAAVFIGSRWLVARLCGVRGLSLFGFESTPWQDAGLGQRTLFTAIGPLSCYVTAVALFALAQLSMGRQEPTLRLVVSPDGAAALAGVRNGDEAVSLAGTQIKEWQQLVDEVRLHPNEEVTFVVKRGGREVSLPVSLSDPPQLKVMPEMQRFDVDLTKVLKSSFIMPLKFWKEKLLSWVDPEVPVAPMRIDHPSETPLYTYVAYAGVLGAYGLPVPLLVAFAAFPRRNRRKPQGAA